MRTPSAATAASGGALDGDDLGVTVRRRRPRLDQLAHRQRRPRDRRSISPTCAASVGDRSASEGRCRRSRRPRRVYSASAYAGSHGCGRTGCRAGRPRRRDRSWPRSAHSWAMKPSRGPAGRCGAQARRTSWCWATTSVSGPIVNRPLSSSSTCAAHSRRSPQRQPVLGQASPPATAGGRSQPRRDCGCAARAARPSRRRRRTCRPGAPGRRGRRRVDEVVDLAHTIGQG